MARFLVKTRPMPPMLQPRRRRRRPPRRTHGGILLGLACALPLAFVAGPFAAAGPHPCKVWWLDDLRLEKTSTLVAPRVLTEVPAVPAAAAGDIVLAPAALDPPSQTRVGGDGVMEK